MIIRHNYLEQLIKWKDEAIIKVITGIRRCGKSTLLLQYKDWLQSQGISEEQIIYLNFEDLAHEDLCNYKNLYQYIIDRVAQAQKTYLLFDEIQRVQDFEKAVNSLSLQQNIDIYLTGSNAFILSGELATYLSGRYVEISILPFSFAEYAEIVPGEDKEKLFANYLEFGGFPYVAAFAKDEDKSKISMYFEGIYNTILIKDIEERQNRKEKENARKVTDIALLKNIAKFMASSVGNLLSVKSITDYINSTGRKVSQNTIADYLEVLTEAFVFYSVDRFDIQGKQLLKSNPKYYMVDLGLRRFLVARKEYDLGFSLENIVYFELLRRGYSINIGKFGKQEVDFVCQKDNTFTYVQVTASMIEETTFLREISPLKAIKDNYPKIILTLDKLNLGNYEGIEVINALDWLLKK